MVLLRKNRNRLIALMFGALAIPLGLAEEASQVPATPMAQADNLEIEAEILNLGDMAGYCIWSDSNIAPRSFELELNVKQSDEDLIVTVMHEMVHVWQYATGRVRERFRPMHRQIWKNSSRWYGDTKYSELPWEREAYKLQEELYDKYTIGSS